MMLTVAMLLLGSLGVVASFYVPALEMWGPLFLSLVLLGGFLAWPTSPEAGEERRGDKRTKAA